MKKKILLLLFGAICSFAATNNNLKTVTLQLKWNHQFQFAGYYMAKEKGYYKDVGLNVNFKQLSETKDAYADVLQGKTEFGIYTSELLLKYHRGDPVVAVAAIFQHSPMAIMVLKNSNIRKLQDLKDKKVMMESGYAELEAYLKRENVRLLQKNIIEHTADAKALIKGQADAMSVYITDEPGYLERHNMEYRLFTPADANIDFYGDILYTTQNFAKANPALVESFKKASIKGWEYALSHPDEAAELILKKYKGVKKTKEELLFEAAQMQKLIKSDTIEIGYLYLWRLNNMLKVYSELGMTYRNGKKNLSDFIFENYIDKLRNGFLSLTDDEKNYIASKKELFVCIDPNWAPIEYITSDGKYEGITSDFMKKLAARLGIKITLLPTKTWKDSVDSIKNGKCDMLALATENRERQKYLTFSTPYFSTPLALVTKDDKPFFDNPAFVFDKPLAVVKDYAFIAALKQKYPNAKIIDVKDQDDGLQMVKDGEVYGFIDALSVASYYVAKSEWKGLKISGKLDESFELGCAVRNEDKILAAIVEKGLRSITDEEKEGIYVRWQNVIINEGVDKKIVFLIVSISAFLLLLLYFRGVWFKKRAKEEMQKRLLQEQIMTEQAKAAQMGEMVDTIAHQWKQPLSTIGFCMGDLIIADKSNAISSEFLLSLKEKVDRQIAFLVKTLDSMRGFLKPDQAKTFFALDDTIKETLNLVEGSYKNLGVEIELELDEEIEMYGVKNLFQNVFLSVIINCRDIFKQRKTVLPKIKIILSKSGDETLLRIEDNGGGIEADVVEKIFDYRFSTKKDKESTGVGLYLVRLIVQEKLNGSVKAFNTDEGACFELRFKALK
ncbi:MAG: ABC transporter substrate-binding protein [Campylobacterales bacterium]|nr:ABC transporter substrate-binding protein [Campylobacterales bacterium]